MNPQDKSKIPDKEQDLGIITAKEGELVLLISDRDDDPILAIYQSESNSPLVYLGIRTEQCNEFPRTLGAKRAFRLIKPIPFGGTTVPWLHDMRRASRKTHEYDYIFDLGESVVGDEEVISRLEQLEGYQPYGAFMRKGLDLLKQGENPSYSH